jgi:hypothetical protein
MIFFLKIQLLVLSIGLYAVFKDNKKLIKMMTSGLEMGAFVFINLLLTFLLIVFQSNVRNIKESTTPIADSIVYTIFVIIIIELILYSMVSNINTIAYDFHVELHLYHKMALIITQSLIIIVNIGLIVLLSILFTRNKNQKEQKFGSFMSKTYKKTKIIYRLIK